MDARYTRPLHVAPTITSRYGTGGNNVPLVSKDVKNFRISGSIIGRETQNEGNGFVYQLDIVYTPTGMERINLVRRLTPLECERLQGFPDGWRDIPGASDSTRYKALGNSVAIPCVDFILRRIAFFLKKMESERLPVASG